MIRRHFLLRHIKSTEPIIEGELSIVSPLAVVAESANFVSKLDDTDVTDSSYWSVSVGSEYAHFIGSTLLISEGSDNESIVILCQYMGKSATASLTVTYKSGSSSSTETSTNIDPETGETTTTTTTITVNEDGSSETTTTNYNSDGEPETTVNNTIDVSGNSNTQSIEYNETGEPIVTEYTIDTSGNTSGTGEILNGTGVNTEFIPFDGVNGFELHIRFRSVKTEQPNPPIVVDTEDRGANYHFTILASKSAYSPYPGFHIRWTLNKSKYSSGNLIFGYKGNTSGNTTNRQLALSKNNDMYDFTITYDPNLVKYPSKFRCQDNLNGGALQTVNIEFNPLDIDFTLGYNLNQQGQPYRYSNVTIYDFSISKL